MKFHKLRIKNFKSIRDLQIEDIDYAFILVGKNNTGKTVVLDAIRAITGDYTITDRDYNNPDKPVEISVTMEITEEDLQLLHARGCVSKYKRYEMWEKDFCSKLPTFQDNAITFTFFRYSSGKTLYMDNAEGARKKSNNYIPWILPKIHYIDHNRNLEELENDFLHLLADKEMQYLKENKCIFDQMKQCSHCFQCVGKIQKKMPDELTISEIMKLLEHKLYHTNLSKFSEVLNKCFHRNSGKAQDIKYQFNFDVDEVLKVDTLLESHDKERYEDIHQAGAGTKSIYILSLLEAYIEGETSIPSIIMIEEPEIYLHPQLQKSAGEVLYKLSKKNQVIFSTHSPNMLFNFSSRQIKQVVLDEDYYTIVREGEEIDDILDDLGYAANDLMNVSFVFIVEGKQDRSRLPLLLERYYSEMYDEEGKLQRISIITTNSCTNIKTYANLKYINKLYLKDQFLMIRDSDGKKPEYLTKQLCNYYNNREREDTGNLPRVTPKNVLILKYYSFENYFLDPEVMTQIGIVRSVDEFYNILYQKYKDYLYRLTSVRRMQRIIGKRINSRKDIIDNMESIRIFVRGHNLYDIFYGRYRGEEEIEILKRYIEAAPRSCFKDILTAIDRFVFFENRKKE